MFYLGLVNFSLDHFESKHSSIKYTQWFNLCSTDWPIEDSLLRWNTNRLSNCSAVEDYKVLFRHISCMRLYFKYTLLCSFDRGINNISLERFSLLSLKSSSLGRWLNQSLILLRLLLKLQEKVRMWNFYCWILI